jgi:hypothetical protein
MDEYIDKPQRTPDELRLSLENVDRQMIEVEAEKKAAVKNYNERLKDLKSERDAIIEQLGQ